MLNGLVHIKGADPKIFMVWLNLIKIMKDKISGVNNRKRSTWEKWNSNPYSKKFSNRPTWFIISIISPKY